MNNAPGSAARRSTDSSLQHASPALVADRLVARFRRRTVVNDVSFSVARGGCVGLLGANGAGKSTTVSMLAGLKKPNGGSVRICGLDPRRDRGRVRAVLGVQLQHAQLHDALRVGEVIDLHRSFYERPFGRDEVLELVGLEDERRTRFDYLSGGQQQRLAIATALVGRPKVVILDELTTGLDPAAKRRIWSAVEQLRADGVSVLLVSHAMDEVERLCDEIVLLEAGRVIASGTPASVTAAAGATRLEDAFLTLTGTPADELEATA